MAIEINHSETRGPGVDGFLETRPTPACFIPICLYSFMANSPFLSEYLPWAINQCDSPRILIGDYMERHNIMAFESLSEENAIAKAERRGQKTAKAIRTILTGLKPHGAVRVSSCREVIETPDCQKTIAAVRDFSLGNSAFNTDIDQQISLMISNTQRLSEKALGGLDEAKMARLREYMIEEIAFFIALYSEGYTTEIYPGRDMSILQKMAACRYRKFPYNFSERTHISVAVLLDSGTAYAQLDDNDSKGD